MKLYLSYGATGETKLRKGESLAPEDWFIIQPYDGPVAEGQRERLRQSRTVIEVEVPDGPPQEREGYCPVARGRDCTDPACATGCTLGRM